MGSCSRVPRARCAVLAAMLAGIAVGAPAAEFYRWTDPDGAVHFADRPPEETPPGGIEGPPRATVEELRERDRIEAERLAAEQQRAQEAEEAQRKLEEDALRALNETTIESAYDCQQARGFLAYYSGNDLDLYQRDADGVFRPMNPEQLRSTVAEWQRAVELLCTDAKPTTAATQ